MDCHDLKEEDCGRIVNFQVSSVHPLPDSPDIQVVGDTLEAVTTAVRVLPQFVWVRQNWAILRPLVTCAPTE